MDFLYNIYNEEVQVAVNDKTNEATCTFENGVVRVFSSYDKAISELEKMGFRF